MARLPLVEALAEFFRRRPHEFHNARVLADVAGFAGWRTQVSRLRRAPYFMAIENRQTRVKRADGSAFVVTEYAYRPAAAESKPAFERSSMEVR